MRRLVSVLVAGSFLALAAGAASPGRVPDLLYMEDLDHPRPDWVIAERVLTPSGAVDPDLFSPEDRDAIESILSAPLEGDCVRVGIYKELERIGQHRRRDLQSAARNSDWVLTARVTARATGFHRDIPGTLLQILPVEIMKGARNRLSEHYIFMPIGTLHVGGVRICKSHPYYSDLPEVGEEVLLFLDVESTWLNKGDFLWTDEESGIVTLHANQEISLPERYRRKHKGLAGQGRAGLLRLIRDAIQETP